MADAVYIENLSALRGAIRLATGNADRTLTAALKAAGAPAVRFAGEIAPVGDRPDDLHQGQLAASYGVSARGSVGRLTSSAPYGAGAEWGQHGKWAGFVQYGPPGLRIAGRAVAEKAEEIYALLSAGINPIAEIYGWAT